MGKGRQKPIGVVRGIESLPGEQHAQEHGMLFDERMLSREQTLARFFTPHVGKEDLKPSTEMLFSAPQCKMVLLNPRSSFVAPQIRDAYDPTRIQRLGLSLRDTNHGQLQNCGVAFIDTDHIEQYVDDMNRYFYADVSIDDLFMHPEFGCYVVTIFGHNRQLAIASANLDTYGNPDSGLLMEAKMYENPSYWEVIGMQATENTGESPNMWARSRSIVQYQALRNRDGIPVSKEKVATVFNVDKDQIWRAERYDALPQGIKELVVGGYLPYSGSFELDALLPFYGEEAVVALAERLADSKASTPKIIENVKKRMAATVLTPEIRNIIEEGHITLVQAQELVKLRSYLSADALNEFTGWICTTCPDIEEIRTRVKKIIYDKVQGNVGFFDEDFALSSSNTIEILTDYRHAEMRAGVQRAVREITRHIGGLRSALSTGLFGGIVELRPISVGAPEHLRSVVSLLVETVNNSEAVSYADIKKQIEALKIDNSLDAETAGQVDLILSALVELLEFEANETDTTQADRRRELAGRVIVYATTEKPTQEGLF